MADAESTTATAAAAVPDDAEESATPQFPTLHEPAGGVPKVCSTPEDLAEAVSAFAAGSGPVALDAERASGHRYGQRAFLIQAKRAGAGIALIDPEALPDLTSLANVIGQDEWILHAATQDLACLADVGLRPSRLFDTELAGRILNLPRVGLASLTESLLGWHLAKGHGAADWSVRPLPSDYLRYAALDVELLIELRNELEARLHEAGKWDWAVQEFEYLVTWSPTQVVEPWRRTSGVAAVRGARNLAVLRTLWLTRDALAEQIDIAPGRLLPDSALVAAAQAMPDQRSGLLEVPGFKRQQRRLSLWWQAVVVGRQLPESALPSVRAELDGPPNPRLWAAREPEAAKRLADSRARVIDLAREHDLPPEILISPDTVRRLAWQPPASPEAVAAALRARGARPWQVELIAADLAAALFSD